MNRDSLLKQLTVLDFAAVDLQLYLDTHPDDAEALKQYNDTIIQADALRAEYEKRFGPLFSFRSYEYEQFNWPDNPWPWENKFNFRMSEED